MLRQWVTLIVLCCATSSAQQVATVARQQDLNYVLDQVTKLHPDFFFQLDRTQFQKAVDNLTAQISTATDAEFYVGLTQLVAMAGDGHTSIFLNGGAAAAIGFRSFPLMFRWLDDGIFVTAAPEPYARAVGTQLVAVAGMPINQGIDRLATVISHNNDQGVQYLAQQYLRGQQILQGLHVLPAGNPSPLTFRSLAGEEFTLQVAPGGSSGIIAPDPRTGPIPDYLRNAGLNYWYTYSAANRLLYFKYNQCVEDAANPFATFAAQLLRTLDQNTVDTFVFDLRGNGGGGSTLWNPLIEGLQARLPSFVGNPRFRLYAVIDKGTASSAMDDAMALKMPLPPELTGLFPGVDLSRLTIQLFGEPTSGKPAEFGMVQRFTLPGSQLLGQYSTTYFPNPSYIPDLPSLMPDVRINMRSIDYFARHDPVMAAILARTPSLPSLPAGSVITVNGASYRTDQGIAPGSFAAAFGAFAATPDHILVAGVEATVVNASRSQVNFIVPSSGPKGVAPISVRSGGAELGSGQFTISAAGAGIFILNAADNSQPGAIENQDFSVNGSASPARSGSVIQIFATGYGDGVSVQVYVAGIPAQVLFSGVVAPGLWQMNARLPDGATGQVPVFVVAGNLASNAVTVYVQ